MKNVRVDPAARPTTLIRKTDSVNKERQFDSTAALDTIEKYRCIHPRHGLARVSGMKEAVIFLSASYSAVLLILFFFLGKKRHSLWRFAGISSGFRILSLCYDACVIN
ncbi:hypothetical protein Y032_0012g1611 [Ancylostoma ceylanicum]|uniref:Uncharacterized protein n=1 Tax=Ancylostoma ceylanicum TaxID=53326 RepID=A0A016VCI3_9BILA|nr:hypothetical protein Y032_0012g1611 [Ancylostoma ceylanicum]